MIAAVPSATLVSTTGRPVTVEVHVSAGTIPGFTLPDAAVREARVRVRAALLSSDLEWPLRRSRSTWRQPYLLVVSRFCPSQTRSERWEVRVSSASHIGPLGDRFRQ
jgi:hypothetical protein